MASIDPVASPNDRPVHAGIVPAVTVMHGPHDGELVRLLGKLRHEFGYVDAGYVRRKGAPQLKIRMTAFARPSPRPAPTISARTQSDQNRFKTPKPPMPRNRRRETFRSGSRSLWLLPSGGLVTVCLPWGWSRFLNCIGRLEICPTIRRAVSLGQRV